MITSIMVRKVVSGVTVMKNKIFNITVVVLFAGILLSFFIYTKGLDYLMIQIKTLNLSWIFMAVVGVILFLLFETLILYIITKEFCNVPNLFVKSVRYEMIGQFFGAITPCASGSHAMQLYAMTENDIPAGISGSILMIKFLTHQIVIILYLILALIFEFSYFNAKINYFLYLCIGGFIVHLSIILGAILFCVNRKMTERILTFSIRVLSKIRIVKNTEATYKKIELELENFHENAVLITKHMKMWINTLILTALQWLAYFSIPYFIYRSFGFDSAGIWIIIAAQIFLTNFMTIIPLPGAEGGAEGGFFVIYSLFFSADTVIAAILIWRVITYYLVIAVSSIFTVILPNKSENKCELENKDENMKKLKTSMAE